MIPVFLFLVLCIGFFCGNGRITEKIELGIEVDMEKDETRYMDRVSTFDHGYNSENPAFVQEGHLMMIDFKIQIADGKERERLSAIKTTMMAETSPEYLQIL